MPLISNEKEETYVSRFSQSTQIKLSCVYYMYSTHRKLSRADYTVPYTHETLSCKLHGTLFPT